MNVGRFINHVRLLRGLSLSDCAASVGCSARMLSSIESSTHSVSTDVLTRLASVLRVDIDVLIVLLVPEVKSAKPSTNKIIKAIKSLDEAEMALEELLNDAVSV